MQYAKITFFCKRNMKKKKNIKELLRWDACPRIPQISPRLIDTRNKPLT